MEVLENFVDSIVAAAKAGADVRIIYASLLKDGMHPEEVSDIIEIVGFELAADKRNNRAA